MSSPDLGKTLSRAFQLHRSGNLQDALYLYARVLKRDPMNAPALHYAALLGRHLNEHARAEGRPTKDDEVMRLMALSVAAAPTNAAAIHNFAKFKQDRGELQEAKHLYDNAVRIDPDQGESWTNLGNVYGELGNRMRAEACWVRALECQRGTAEAEFNLSFLRLMKGDFAGGWAGYEARWQSPTFVHSYGRGDLRSRRWHGEETEDTVFVHQEQGAGDAIMMARYIPLIEARVGRVVIEVIRGMVTLFQAVFPGVEVAARGDRHLDHQANVPMLSLPHVFGTTLENIPEPVSFRVRSAEGSPIPVESCRIGLCWAGSTTHVNDRIRSMPFEATFPMLDVPGLSWQSLQFGYDTAPPLEPLPVGDFLETARQIARCELVVSVDTSIAHLAASMGVPTIILLPFSAEWRWLQDREDSPWYPFARLWRQESAGDWHGLAERVAHMLALMQQPSAAV